MALVLSLSLIFFCLTAALSMPIPKSVAVANAIPFMSPDKLEEMRSNVQEYIKHMGIPHEKFLTPDNDEDMDPMWNEELSFGDLMMEEEKEQSEETEQSSSNEVQDGFESGGGGSSGGSKSKKHKKPKKWTQKDIPYYISKDFNPKQRRFIEEAIEEMNSKVSVVRFRPYQENDRNYVMVFNGKGCFSKLGMVGGQQPMSLQSDKCLSKKGTVQHEFMHVLGFSHTQNRPDRDRYIKIEYNNIPKKWYKDYVRLSKSETIFIGKYDYFSVLHYPVQAPKSHGKKIAIQVLEKNVNPKQVGLQKRLSENDIAMAKELYST